MAGFLFVLSLWAVVLPSFDDASKAADALEEARRAFQRDVRALLVIARADVDSTAAQPPARAALLERLRPRLAESEAVAKRRLDAFEAVAEEAAAQNRPLDAALLERLDAERKAVQRLAGLVATYWPRVAAVQTAPAAGSRTAGSQPADRARRASPLERVSGRVSARVGTTTFDGREQVDETAQDLSLSVRYALEDRSALTVRASQRRDVVLSAFTNTAAQVGYTRTTAAGLRVEAYGGYQGYEDQRRPINDFRQLTAGAVAAYPLSASATWTARVSVEDRAFEADVANGFQGIGYDTALRMRPGRGRFELGVRGRTQSSDAAFLSFNRIKPRLTWAVPTGQRSSVELRGSFEQTTYGEGASGNDFRSARGELAWLRSGRRTSLTADLRERLTSDVFTTYTFRFDTRSSGTRRSRLYAQYVLFPNRDGSDFVDLRAELGRRGRGGFFDATVFSRVWMSEGRRHVVDAVGRFGVNVSGVEIGPLAGARLSIDPDDVALDQDGNSLRAGLAVRANRRIERATVAFDGRYEYGFVYSSAINIDRTTGLVTRGEVSQRNPTTLLFNLSVRYPVTPQFDVRLDARRYAIDPDIDPSQSINPFPDRSSTRLLIGLSYAL